MSGKERISRLIGARLVLMRGGDEFASVPLLPVIIFVAVIAVMVITR